MRRPIRRPGTAFDSMSPVARLSVGWLATADTRRGNRPGSAGAPTSSIPCHGLRPRPRRSQSHQVGLRTQSRFPTRREPREPSERRLTDVTVPSPDDNPRPRPGAAGATRTRSGPPSMRERHDAPGAPPCQVRARRNRHVQSHPVVGSAAEGVLRRLPAGRERSHSPRRGSRRPSVATGRHNHLDVASFRLRSRT